MIYDHDYESEPEPSMDPEARRALVRQLLGSDAPRAWCELIEGLAILAHAHSNDISPLHCEPGELTVCAQPAWIALPELERLEEIGFHSPLMRKTFARAGSAAPEREPPGAAGQPQHLDGAGRGGHPDPSPPVTGCSAI